MVSSTGTFVSCKDYDDDIDELWGAVNGGKEELSKKVSALETSVSDLQGAQTKLEAEIAHLKELVVPEVKPKTVTVDVIRTVHDTIMNAQSDSEKATAINSIVDHIIYDKEADTMEFFFVP